MPSRPRYEHPIRLTFVTHDGAEKRHEKTIVLSGIAEWAQKGGGPDPIEPPLLPWYRCWFRKVVGWLRSCF